MSIYHSKIVAQKDEVLEARRAQNDAQFRGDTGRAHQAAAAVDAGLDRINELKALEKYRAKD